MAGLVFSFFDVGCCGNDLPDGGGCVAEDAARADVLGEEGEELQGEGSGLGVRLLRYTHDQYTIENTVKTIVTEDRR